MSKLGLGCVLVLTLSGLINAPAALGVNPVQAENALPGDSYWTAATHDPVSANPPIAGYASANSVRPGGSITFQVSTNPVARYRIEISRLGWYGGSGGRRLACLSGAQLDPGCSLDHLGVQQPAPSSPDAVTGEIRAGWSATDTLTVPSGWASGYYLAVFRLTSGPSAGQTGFTPFIVQAAQGEHSSVLVQVPTNTWQAYNGWGGEGIYTSPRAVKASFDRPYAHRLLFNWEYPLVRFLERGGWDVSYATDDDVDADPSILLNHTLDVSAGHDEYWSKTMRDGWEAARAAGINLAFMGANDGFWQVRYEDGRRTMVAYKYSADPDPDPALRTTEFRWLSPPRDECALLGVEFQNVILISRNIDATADSAVAQDPWFAGTGLQPGAVVTGVGGGETDEVTPGCHVPPVTPLLSYSGAPLSNGTPARGDAVRYTACSGAEVFSGGSLQFSWGLDSWRDPSYSAPGQPPIPPANSGLQRAMTQALADLTRSHVPVPGPPHICVPSAGIVMPQAWVAAGQRVTFRSAVSDPYGYVSGQRWSFSLGGSSATASNPAVTRVFRRAGVARVSLVVTDSSGATATATRTLQVCPCPAPGQPHAISWPPGAQSGSPCQLSGIGSLRILNGRASFAANAAVKRLSITTYRIAPQGGRITVARVASSSRAGSSTPVPVPRGRAPLLVDVTAGTAGHLRHQQFLLTYDPIHRGAQPGLLEATLCDGTAGQILTPAFGGRHARPLRLALTGRGRVVVSVVRIGGGPAYHRLVIASRKPGVLSLPAAGLPRGVYRVTVSAWHSKLPQPIRLTALRL